MYVDDMKDSAMLCATWPGFARTILKSFPNLVACAVLNILLYIVERSMACACHEVLAAASSLGFVFIV